jgi:hypothetical protein
VLLSRAGRVLAERAPVVPAEAAGAVSIVRLDRESWEAEGFLDRIGSFALIPSEQVCLGKTPHDRGDLSLALYMLHVLVYKQYLYRTRKGSVGNLYVKLYTAYTKGIR